MMQLLLTDTATLESNGDLPLDVFDKFGNVTKFDNITREELLTAAADKDIILCNKTVMDREIMNAAPQLRYIGLFATGYNNIDIAAAKEKGITVCNAGSYSTNAVTQQVIGYILMHYTKIPQYDAFVKQGGWKRSGVFSPLIFSGDEVYGIFSYIGQTLGFVGAMAVVLVMVFLCLRTLANGLRANDRQGMFLCIGVSSMIFTHCFMNIGMVLKVMPVIGVPLPFLSAGGTSTLSMYIAIGMVISVRTHNERKYNVFYDYKNPTLARVGR